MLEISEKSRISKLADIEDSTRGTTVVIGEGTMIDSFVKIKCAGGTGDVRIGKNSFLNSGVVIYSGNGVTIGDGVLIAANTTIAPVNHEFRSKDKTIVDQRFQASRGGIVIEDDVWIGANCVILDGAVLRQGCVVGAGSVVRGELAAYTINMGSPARVVGHRQ